jgi:histidyl-tRNA synthetase
MALKPSIPKGTRDFSPSEVMKRDYIFNIIREVFRLHGYQPLETPAMENLSTLLGKYGEEGDKLIFRILNSGDFLNGVAPAELSEADSVKISPRISEKGLRYDLTVPFARYIVQHQGEITFPFKRYQVQPVWRADRPQKGRYREFFQCDADVIGSDSLFNEYELVKIADEVFARLGINVIIKINNRKILAGIAEIAGESGRITDITVAIDKIEKIGMDAAIQELLGKGIPAASVEKLKPVLELKGDTDEMIERLGVTLLKSETGLKGLEELKTLFELIKMRPPRCRVELDLTLARGLNYYTGAIIEVKAADMEIGSICGGGRYDDLTGIFGLGGVSGVGISFGADRIYDVMTALQLFDEGKNHSATVMIVNFGTGSELYSLEVLDDLHNAGISACYYPEPAKIKKQLTYADSNKIPFVVMAGSDEIAKSTVTVKNMISGSQETVSKKLLAGYFPSEK